MRASLFVAAALCAAACSKGSGSSDEANTDRLLALLEAVANTAPAPGEGCEMVGARLQAVIENHRKDKESLEPWMDEMKKDDARMVKMVDRMAPRLPAIRDKMKSLLTCESELKKAEAQLKGLMNPDGP